MAEKIPLAVADVLQHARRELDNLVALGIFARDLDAFLVFGQFVELLFGYDLQKSLRFS